LSKEKPPGGSGSGGANGDIQMLNQHTIKIENPTSEGALGGRIINYQLSRAILAAYRGKRHHFWISLARLAARISERGAV
jgi:hypothetical protein